MVNIPILREGEVVTAAYIVALRDAISSDGCTDVPDFYGHCCVVHDLMYRYRIDVFGKPCKKRDADTYIRACMEGSSFIHRFSILAKIYWLGVKAFGAWAYANDVDEMPAFVTYVWTHTP